MIAVPAETGEERLGAEAQHMAWKIRSSRYIIESPHLRLRADEIELPNGAFVNEYFVRESRGYAVVCALTPSGQAVLVRQYKHGIGGEVIELPAGGIDIGESPADCAARELAEETGYLGETPELLGAFIADPTGSNGRFYLYLIRNAEPRVAQNLDPTESITVELVPFQELRTMVRDGRIDVTSQVTAILYIFDLIETGMLLIE